MNHLIIAPHSDDALLSLGGVILKWGEFKILNVFSTCGWSVIPTLKDPRKITTISKQEEKLAVQRAGADLEFLDINEALLRGYRHWNDPLDKQKDGKIKKKIKQEIIKRLKNIKVIYFPLSVGNHTDHCFIFELFKKLRQEEHLKGKIVFLFEDLPYAISSNLKQKLENVRKFVKIEEVLVDVTSVIDKKCLLLYIYKSQLTSRDILAVEKYAQSISPKGKYYERIWQVKDDR